MSSMAQIEPENNNIVKGIVVLNEEPEMSVLLKLLIWAICILVFLMIVFMVIDNNQPIDMTDQLVRQQY